MNNQEEWRPIPGWEGVYSVSNIGNVRSEDRTTVRLKTGVPQFNKGQPIKPWIAKSSGGYHAVALSKNDYRKTYTVHRLVMWAFVGPQAKGIDVRHLDGNCLNNNLENLCYGTRKENIHDSMRHGTFVRITKLTEEQVIEICRMGREKISSKVVGAKFNINRNTVTELWRGDIWKEVTVGLLPESNQPKKYDKISPGHKAIIMNCSIKITEAAKIVGIERHTAARWRKMFNNPS